MSHSHGIKIIFVIKQSYKVNVEMLPSRYTLHFNEIVKKKKIAEGKKL